MVVVHANVARRSALAPNVASKQHGAGTEGYTWNWYSGLRGLRVMRVMGRHCNCSQDGWLGHRTPGICAIRRRSGSGIAYRVRHASMGGSQGLVRQAASKGAVLASAPAQPGGRRYKAAARAPHASKRVTVAIAPFFVISNTVPWKAKRLVGPNGCRPPSRVCSAGLAAEPKAARMSARLPSTPTHAAEVVPGGRRMRTLPLAALAGRRCAPAGTW